MTGVTKTLVVAGALCVVCSILVSTSAVLLKPAQTVNADRDMKKNVLSAASLLSPGADIDAIYTQHIEERLIDLATGETLEDDPKAFQLRRAEKDPASSVKIENDFARLNRRATLSPVYFIKDDNGAVSGVVLPIRSQGLWGVMYGFLALKNDARTVLGFQYYSQVETPGLGGEVDNPKWKAQWVGKEVLGPEGRPEIALVKTGKSSDPEVAKHQVDALSGATITTQGVQNSLRYWLGPDAYGPFLEKFKSGGLS